MDTDDLLDMFRNITTNDHDALVNQFSSILQLDPSTAAFFLESSNWNVEVAANTYLSTISDAHGGGHAIAQMHHLAPQASFVTDLTEMQSMQFPPGKVVNMNWTFKNTGASRWPADTQLVFVDGFNFEAPETLPISTNEQGTLCNIPVQLITPSQEGTFYGTWRLAHEMGYFGDPVWIIFHVCKEDQSLEQRSHNGNIAAVAESFPSQMMSSGGDDQTTTTNLSAVEDMTDL